MSDAARAGELSARAPYALVALLSTALLINYVDRSNLSIAAPMLKDELKISAEQLGWLLSAFFWTYAACQILAGWLVDRLDVKYVFATGFVLWSAATAITGFLHGLAALLATIGLYGVLAYNMVRRRNEIGIRTALGASRGSIYRMILSEAGRLIGLGAAAGIGASMATAGLMSGLLFGVGSWDAPTLAMVAGILGTVALLATLIPARRAASVDPVESLRAE